MKRIGLIKKWLAPLALIAFTLLIPGSSLLGQTSVTFQTSGGWNVSGNWAGGNVGDQITENVTINDNVNATLVDGNNYTVGNVAASNGNAITINSGATLNVGASGNAKDLTFNNNGSLNVGGILEIWGDLVVNNSLTLNITGTMIVHGNIVMNNGGSLNVSGNLTVDGNFIGGNNTEVVVDGSIAVAGTVEVGNNSNLSGSGTFTAGGGCAGPATFCNATPLPIKLLRFSGESTSAGVLLRWSTALEENFDKFLVEHSADGIHFNPIGEVNGAGKNTKTRQDYSFEDSTPYPSRTYYRLKSLDLDGKFEYSNIIKVDVVSQQSITVYPNPVINQTLTVEIDFEPMAYDKIQIIDATGAIVAEYPVSTLVSKIQFDSQLRSGMYVLRYKGENKERTLRFFVNN